MATDRSAQIVAHLESVRSLTADELAERLGVSPRTVATHVSALQRQLGAAASIAFADGRYRLLVADPQRYRKVRQELVPTEVSFNDPGRRESFIVGRLFRSVRPLRIDELSREMNVGRTTVVEDLARIRQSLADTDVTVAGRRRVGLELRGAEVQQRLYVLRHHFLAAYPASTETALLEDLIADVITPRGLDRSAAAELARWVEVAVDRARLGCVIDYLPKHYQSLQKTAAWELANSIVKAVEGQFQVALSADDVTFLAVPIAGIRAPDDDSATTDFVPDTASLVSGVLAEIRGQMNIDLAGSEFLAEFARHLGYMINRMRYRIWIDDSGVANIGSQYPVAYEMAQLACQVVESQVGLPVDDAEVGFLAAYFQVFLDTRRWQSPPFLTVIVVAAEGRVTAELVRLQLAKLMPPSTRFQVITTDAVDTVDTTSADLVVVAGDADVDCQPTPVMRVTRLLDRVSLQRELARLQLNIPLRSTNREGSALAGSLDEAHFFALPGGTDYLDAVEYMARRLESDGLVETGFADRILTREARAETRLDPALGFPHAVLNHTSSVMLSVGVIPRDDTETGVRVIVLLGVPADPSRSEPVLVQVYDEVLRLGARRGLLNQLCRLTTFEDFYYLLENSALIERER